MSEDSIKNKRIAKNTVMLYFRMLLILVVTLYTSRVVLDALGVSDFGIYNVVGGIVIILGFFTSSLSNVSQRYINIGLGSNDNLLTEKYFKQCFSLMFSLSLVVLVIGETVGLWFVCNELVIPPDRLHAAIWVYQFSLITTVISINKISFMGAIIAHEKMGIYAYIGIFEAVIKLAIAYLLIIATSIDSLILYSGLMALASVVISLSYIIYAMRHFTECKMSFYWDSGLVKEMSKFLGSNVFGCLSWSLGQWGVNILLNIFFGPLVNAARAISMQVTTAVIRFSDNIMTAVKPQIIQSYVSGNHNYMIGLVERSSKYAFYLTVLIIAPIIIEVNAVLYLWLGQIPEYSALFTRLVLCDAAICSFTPALWIAATATGNIKRNQVYGRLFTLSTLPLSYLFLKLGASPYVPFVITLFSSLGYWMYCLYDIHEQIAIKIKGYLKKVVLPTSVLSIMMLLIGIIITTFIPQMGIVRVIITFCSTTIVGLTLVYIMLDNEERNFVKKTMRRLFHQKNK